MLPKFYENSIFYGDENNGIEIAIDGLYVYENGKKLQLVTSDGRPTARTCRCGSEGTVSRSYHLDEIEASVCPECGGLIVKLKGLNVGKAKMYCHFKPRNAE